MSRARKFDDTTCKNLAQWFERLRGLGSVAAKARELGVSEKAVRDAIARGNGTYEARHKLSESELGALVDQLGSTGNVVE
jgi:hypothetical protein